MLIDLQHIHVSAGERSLLKDVHFHVDAGEFVYLTGRVGSGKSSLLKTLYAELAVEAEPNIEGAKAEVLGRDIFHLRQRHVQALRREMGIVFQDFQLLRDRNVDENLHFVLRATGWKHRAERQARIADVLAQVELSDKGDSFPHQLSGGEQQRIAIARALLNKPKLILADEPTGNLDKETGERIVTLLRNIASQGTAVVMITHNLNLLSRFPGIVYRCEDEQLHEVTNEYNSPIDIDVEHVNG